MRTITKLIGIAALGLICGVGLVFAYRAGTHYLGMAGIVNNVDGSDAAAAASGPSATALAADIAAPAWLVIPSINVDAPIKAVGVNAKGGLGVPSDAVHVAWYKYSPRPGMTGTAVIDGHLDTWNTPQAVFYDLDKLAPGDEVDVKTTAGQTLTFKVASTRTLPYNATDDQIADLYQSTSSTPGLNLITCTGDWMTGKGMYTERLAVFTKLVSERS